MQRKAATVSLAAIILCSGPALGPVIGLDTGTARADLPPQVQYFPKARGTPVESLTPTGKQSKNVILLLVDAMRPDHMGVYGYDKGTTPNLDKLAGEGVIFVNAFSNAPWTRPSMAAYLTGLPYAENGVYDYKKMPADVPTIAERFQKAGFATGGFFANPAVHEKYRFHRGFDKVDVPGGSKSESWRNAPDADVLVDRVLEWIDGLGGKRFFLCMFFVDVHDPWEAPKKWRKRFEPDEVPQRNVERELVRDPGKQVMDGLLGAYDAELGFTDHEIGRFTDTLRKSGVLGETTLVVSADHGEAFGEHGAYRHAFHPWDEVLRVPLILHTPGVKEKGALVTLPFVGSDWSLTLMKAAGLPLPAELAEHGVSAIDAMADGPAYAARDRILFHGANIHGVRRAIARSRVGKLIVHYPTHEKRYMKKFKRKNAVPSAVFGKKKAIYFHLVDDPYEKSPLDPGSHPEGQRLLKALEANTKLTSQMAK